jgi:hypothetical protein
MSDYICKARRMAVYGRPTSGACLLELPRKAGDVAIMAKINLRLLGFAEVNLASRLAKLPACIEGAS